MYIYIITNGQCKIKSICTRINKYINYSYIKYQSLKCEGNKQRKSRWKNWYKHSSSILTEKKMWKCSSVRHVQNIPYKWFFSRLPGHWLSWITWFLRHVWNARIYFTPFCAKVLQILLISLRDWCKYEYDFFISIDYENYTRCNIDNANDSLNTPLHSLIIINTTLYITLKIYILLST